MHAPVAPSGLSSPEVPSPAITWQGGMRGMIHKLSFVNAKPGMSEQDFFTYWKDVHAERYGRKIAQAKGYQINFRVPFGPDQDAPLFQGVSELWFESDQDVIAYLQSPEYLGGVRPDEPRFLTWFGVVTLDTVDRDVIEPPGADWDGVKVFVLTKRKPGLSVEEYLQYGREVHGPKVSRLPGLRGYVQSSVPESAYAISEPLLDTVSTLWFDSTDAIAAAMASPVFQNEVRPDTEQFIDLRYFRSFVMKGHWVVPLGSRS
jgi:uncharacterized protein (TIGR02118 family)